MTKNTEIRATIDSEVYGTLRLWYNPSEDELLYCAKDVAKMFGYKDPGRSVRNLCRHISKICFNTDGGVQRLNFIGQEDICRLCENSPEPDPCDICEYIECVTDDFFCDIENDFADCEDKDYEDDYDEEEDELDIFFDDEHDEGYLELIEKNNAYEIPDSSEATYNYLGKDFIEGFEKALDAYDFLIEAISKALENPELFVKAAVLVADCNAKA